MKPSYNIAWKMNSLLSRNIGPCLLVVSSGRLPLISVWRERYSISKTLVIIVGSLRQLLYHHLNSNSLNMKILIMSGMPIFVIFQNSVTLKKHKSIKTPSLWTTYL